MAGKREDNLEERVFNQIDQRFDAIDSSIKANTDATKKGFKELNSRTKKLENKVFPERPETVRDLPPFWRDSQIIKLFTYVAIFAIIVGVIIAGLTGAKLPSGLFP